MPEFNLPGISNNIDVKSTIDKLVKVESKRLDKYEAIKDKFEKEKSAWIDLKNNVNDLEESANELYGFRSPFDDKIVKSSKEDVITGTASRIATPSSYSIKIERIAQNEKIISDSVDSKKIFDKQTLKFDIGEKEVEIDFKGGRIEELSNSINKNVGEWLTSKLTKKSDKASVIILEVKKTGKENRIIVQDRSTLNFFKQIGLFEEKTHIEVDTTINSEKIVPIDQSKNYKIMDNAVILAPRNSVRLPLAQTIRSSPNIILKIKLRASDIVKEEKEKVETWPELRSVGRVKVKDVEIEGGSAISKLEVIKKKEPVIVDNSIIGVIDINGNRSTVRVEDLGKELKEYTFKLTDIINKGEDIASILFINNNSTRKIEYRDLEIEDTTAPLGIGPKHTIKDSGNAIFYVDGVRIERASNKIDDVIKGINLKIKSKTEDEVIVDVDRDYEKITGEIVKFIKNYNEVLKFINENTKVVPGGNIAETTAGVFAGDITVMGIKNRLKNIMMNPYPTDKGKSLSLLAQIGISMGSTGSLWSDIKGGYLQVDEDKFINSMEENPDSIKQLFGSDNNNDMIVDNGVAYVMKNTLKGYSDSRTGIISYHLGGIDNDIKEEDKNIEDWKEHLDDYRKKLEGDFTIMEQALHKLEQNQKSIENFSKQYNSNK